jgi:CubicO group peptidase (beta-lactamase class C family)
MQPLTRLLLLVSLFAGAPRGDCHAQGPGDDRLGEVLVGIRNRHSVPAIWAGRFHGDGRHVTAVTGVRKEGEDDPARADDLVHIGSCTKAMTAVMVARLCSAGKLSFGTTLAEVRATGAEGELGGLWRNSGTLAALWWCVRRWVK